MNKLRAPLSSVLALATLPPALHRTWSWLRARGRSTLRSSDTKESVMNLRTLGTLPQRMGPVKPPMENGECGTSGPRPATWSPPHRASLGGAEPPLRHSLSLVSRFVGLIHAVAKGFSTNSDRITLTFGNEEESHPAHKVIMWDSGAGIGVEPRCSPRSIFSGTGETTTVRTIYGSQDEEVGVASRGGLRYRAIRSDYAHAIFPGGAFAASGEFDACSLTAKILTHNEELVFVFRRATDGHYYNTNGLQPSSSSPLAPHLPGPLPPDPKTMRVRVDKEFPDSLALRVDTITSTGETEHAKAKRRLGYAPATPWSVALQGTYERLLTPC